MLQPIVLSPDILVVRFSAIGDILLTTPLLRALRDRHPGARITMITKQQFVPLVSHNPNVDEVFGLAPGDRLRAVAERLRGIQYTNLLDLQGNLRSRALSLLVPGPWSTYSKQRLERALLIWTKRDRYRTVKPIAERYFEAAAALDVRPDGGPPEFFLSDAAETRAECWLATAGLGQAESLVAIAPGAAHATKLWPVEYWIELARTITTSGSDVVILGGPGDRQVATEIVAGAGERVVNAAGMLGLQESGAVLRRSAALVSGDTGVMHMATGVGTPVVALFGPTVRQFGFFPYHARATVLERTLSCRPCSAHGSDRCPRGHHLCMRTIAPDAVLAALRALLS